MSSEALERARVIRAALMVDGHIRVRDLWHAKSCAIFTGAACSCGAVAEAVKAAYEPGERP